MKPVLLLLAFAGFAAYSAFGVPIKQVAARDDDAFTVSELQEVLYGLESIDDTDAITYGFGKKFRKGIKKVGRAIEKGVKKALEHGVKWELSIYSTPAKDDLQRDGEVSLEELQDIIWHSKRFTELMGRIPDLFESNRFGEKLREDLEKIGYVLNDAIQKSVSMAEVPIPVSLFPEESQPYILTIVEFEEMLRILDEILDQFNQDEQAQDRALTYGFGKKLRKGLKKVGRAIEKGAKKALEHGLSWNISVYSTSEDLFDNDSRLSFEELRDLHEGIEFIETATENATTYGFGKKLRKGLKKIGKAIEKAGKKVLEKGIIIPIPIRLALNTRQDYMDEELRVILGILQKT